jgi:hypothetical protein
MKSDHVWGVLYLVFVAILMLGLHIEKLDQIEQVKVTCSGKK